MGRTLAGKGWWLAALLSVVAMIVIGPLTPRPATEPKQVIVRDPLKDPVPTWTVDPSRSGDDLPPSGRSLFDHLILAGGDDSPHFRVPFPFTALVKAIETQLVKPSTSKSPLKQVLIPLGRSLQRNAGAPHYFKFPRMVVAVDTEPPLSQDDAGMLLKDRLYIGYHEQAELLEVISYNEAAGRFEFQLVRDYRPGGTPQVLYANRIVCMACHHNQAPIFSRQTWSETNGNVEVAALLKKARGEFHGIPVSQGIEVPNAIDDAIARANRLTASQLFWRDGCEAADDPAARVRCRAALLMAALQYRLSARHAFDRQSASYRQHLLPAQQSAWKKHWPGGLQLPDAGIANRRLEVIATKYTADGVARAALDDPVHLRHEADVAFAFDPLVPRPPSATWRIKDGEDLSIERAVTGLAEFIAEPDVARLDRFIITQASPATRRLHEGDCTLAHDRDRDRTRAGIERVKFQCQLQLDGEPSIELSGRAFRRHGAFESGTVDRLRVASGETFGDLRLQPLRTETTVGELTASFSLYHKVSGRPLRNPAGHRVEAITVAMETERPERARVKLSLIEDFTLVRTAIESLAQDALQGRSDGFAALPFRRAVVLRELEAKLGMPALAWCCDGSKAMPPAVADRPIKRSRRPDNSKSDNHEEGPPKNFYVYCAACHAGKDNAPPNFLRGDRQQTQQQIAQCADRIYVRLAMGEVPPERRRKSLMPPERTGFPPHSAKVRADLASLQAHAAALISKRGAELPSLDRGYADLPDCSSPNRMANRAVAAPVR